MKIRDLLDTAILSICGFSLAIGSAVAQILETDGVAPLPETGVVPEPGTIGIFALGIGALYLISRRKRRK